MEKIKKLLRNKPLVISSVVVLLGIVGFVGYSAWQQLQANAGGENSLTKTQRRYVISADSKKGCELAGRVWSAATEEGKNICKAECSVTGVAYVDATEGMNGYCQGYIVPKMDKARCIANLHRYYVATTGCSRLPDQANSNAAAQCIPGYPNYLADRDQASDKCIAQTIVGAGAPGSQQSDPTSKPPTSDSIKACTLLGRVWDGKGGKCTTTCVPEAGPLLIGTKTGVKYCAKAISTVPLANKTICTERKHRVWLVEGCARRADQKDTERSATEPLYQCQPGYNYYNADFNNKAEDNATLSDVCEKTKAVAQSNEQHGTPGASGNNNGGGNNNNGSSNNNGNQQQGGGKRSPITATVSFQNLGRKEASAVSVFQMIKQTMQDRPNVIYNFVEIDEGDSGEHAALKAVFGDAGWSGFATREPTLTRMDSKWHVMDSEVVKLHGATGNNTGPERVLVITRYENVNDKNARLAVVNTHFVANAYNGNMNARLKPYWNTAWEKMHDRVARLYDNNFDIIITGDFNHRGKLPQIHPAARMVMDSGPDSIIAIPSKGRRIAEKATAVINTPSGESFHRDISARLTFADGVENNQPNTGNPDGNNGVKVGDIKLKNFRDASRVTSGRILKEGVLYRSAELSRIHLNNHEANRLGILLGKDATIIDVRVRSRMITMPDQKVKGAREVKIPIGGVLDQAPMVTDPARRAGIKQVLQTAANAKGDVLIHCTAGKDRTGWIIAMIMYVSGANDADVMKEYMKSNDAWPGQVKPEWMNSGVNLARKNYGSIRNYLKNGVGLSDADIAKLAHKFKS